MDSPSSISLQKADLTSSDKISEQNDEIKRLNVKLQKAYLELESFSYTVSHDLRAPLRAIDGFAQIIKEDYFERLDTYGKSSIETIISSAEKMNALIDDIVSYTRLDQKTIQYQELNIKTLFKEEITTLKESYSNTRVVFDTDFPVVYGDPSMILLLIRNLLDNALKYSSKEVDPLINIGVLDDDVFYIKDNGIGFDQKHSDNIFEVFYRLNNDLYDGSGIGLSIAKRIIEKHSGTVWVESRLNEGASFYFNMNQHK